MSSKTFRDIKAGDSFCPVGSTMFMTASSDARALDNSGQRGPHVVMVRGIRVPALGHLAVEVK